jgi:hypothetical protein
MRQVFAKTAGVKAVFSLKEILYSGLVARALGTATLATGITNG